jgi:putative transposase
MRQNIVAKTQARLIECKYCGSTNVVRFGTRENIQRYWCKDCQRKFVDNKALPGFRVPIGLIGSALNMFYQGSSLNKVCRQLQEIYNYIPSDSTVYEWIVRFSNTAILLIIDYKADVGNVWIADETVLEIDNENLWFWDVIDDKTRFLLASHLSYKRTAKDANILMNDAAERAVESQIS